MNEEERAFREGLRQAVADRPGGVRVDVDEVIARASAPAFVPETRWTPPRWLAAAAAVLVVAGLGVSLAVFRPSAGIPAAPAATSAPSTEFDAASLVGSKWWAVQIDGRSVVAAEGRVPYLQFRSASEVLLYDGCNTGIAGYRLSPGLRSEFSVTLGGMTAQGCLKGDQGRFDDALTAAVSARKNGELLEFLDPNGVVVLQFARANEAEPQPTPSPTGTPTNSVTVAISTPSVGTAAPRPDSVVHLRVNNGAEVPLTDLIVVFADQTVMQVPRLAPGEYSDYDTTVAGFPVASMEATLGGRTYHLRATDAAGSRPISEVEFTPGDHNWTIKLVKDSAVIVLDE